MAPNGLSLTFEDVELIIGILYCVGTVEISPQRVAALLLAAQVMGIPSLIRFLKRIKENIMSDESAGSQSFLAPPPAPPSGTTPFSLKRQQQQPPIKPDQAFVYLIPSTAASVPSNNSSFIDSTAGPHDVTLSSSLPIVKPMTASCLNTPAPQPPLPEYRQLSLENQIPSKQERLEDFNRGQSATPPSRAASRATLASLGSFSLQPLATSPPLTREIANQSNKVVSSVLEGLDPNFLNQINLQSIQIDDLENALLPHLHGRDSQSTEFRRCDTPSRSNMDLISADEPNDEFGNSFSSTDERQSRNALVEVSPQELMSLESQANRNLNTQLEIPPNGCSTPLNSMLPSDRPPNTSNNAALPKITIAPLGKFNNDCRNISLLNDLNDDPIPSTSTQSPKRNFAINFQNENDLPLDLVSPQTNAQQQQQQQNAQPQDCTHPESNNVNNVTLRSEDNNLPPTAESDDSTNKEDAPPNDDEENAENGNKEEEIKVALNSVHEGRSFKFSIPGTSQSVTLNFSADALAKMKTCVNLKNALSSGVKSELLSALDNERSTMEVSSSTSEAEQSSKVATKLKKKKRSKDTTTKSSFQCQLCPKRYPSQRLLDKHIVFHVDQNAACSICGKLFYKRWMLEQHMAVDHDTEESVQCKECGKKFKWHRNLLAHIQLVHQKEVRYRCKNCPLTFLRKKPYIKHHKAKHADAPETWCKVGINMAVKFYRLLYIFTRRNSLVIAIKFYAVHSDIDCPTTIASAFFLRLFGSETFSFCHDEIPVSFLTPSIETLERIVAKFGFLDGNVF